MNICLHFVLPEDLLFACFFHIFYPRRKAAFVFPVLDKIRGRKEVKLTISDLDWQQRGTEVGSLCDKIA